MKMLPPLVNAVVVIFVQNAEDRVYRPAPVGKRRHDFLVAQLTVGVHVHSVKGPLKVLS